MPYAETLRKLFHGIKLNAEDLLFLESFQIADLPTRAPRQELAVLLKAHPVVHRYLVSMCPSVKSFIDEVMGDESTNDKTTKANCDDLLWEIADLIVYSKYPEVYDANVDFPWDIDDIAPPQELAGKVAVDAGAGPGKLSFLLADFASTVLAMEPVSGFRRFIKEKAKSKNARNVFAVDGVLNAMPFPSSSVDFLITSQAIGWDLEAELAEIERILKPNGHAIHLFGHVDPDSESAKGLNDVLTSAEWRYECDRIQHNSATKLRYHKGMAG